MPKLKEKISNTEECLRYQRYINHRYPKLISLSKKYQASLNWVSTTAEDIFCYYLNRLKIKYETQYIIYDKGRFWIIDFYLPDYHLVIELDGSQHYTEEGLAKDQIRTEVLTDLGFKNIIRFKNEEVFNLSLNSLNLILSSLN